MARRLRLPAQLRGQDAVHRPLPLAGAVPRPGPAAPGAARPGARSTASSAPPGRPSASSSATPTSTTPSTRRRSPGASAARPTGRSSLVNLMALHGLAERAVEVEPYRTYELGPFEVSFTPSVHSKLLLGLAVPYDGELSCEHLDSLSPGAYRCGQVWGISIAVAGIRFYHQGSANLIDEAIRERDVDVFLAGVAGRSFTDDYWQRILPRLNPRAVVPTHYDNFFRPLGQPTGVRRQRPARRAARRDRRRQPRHRARGPAPLRLGRLSRRRTAKRRSAWRRSGRSCPSSASSPCRARRRSPSGRARSR